MKMLEEILIVSFLTWFQNHFQKSIRILKPLNPSTSFEITLKSQNFMKNLTYVTKQWLKESVIKNEYFDVTYCTRDIREGEKYF